MALTPRMPAYQLLIIGNDAYNDNPMDVTYVPYSVVRRNSGSKINSSLKCTDN
jgi:hypothetical protein